MDRLIYMDNAATTSVKPEVLNSMLPFFTDNYANPSSIYNFAQKSKKAVEDARTTIADIIGADKPNEIYFTAGGSESDNWALKAAAECFKDKGNLINATYGRRTRAVIVTDSDHIVLSALQTETVSGRLSGDTGEESVKGDE